MERFTARVGIRGRAYDDCLVDLHDRSLDGGGERASGGRAHVHHHATLWRGHLQRGGNETERMLA